MAYTIQFEKSAAKQLSKLEKRVQIKIAAKIDELADDPRPFGYKKLVDEGGTCRVKVAGYRILYDIFDKVLIVNVISVAKRNERTY
jgi:mRNA interferase RelE/StbE